MNEASVPRRGLWLLALALAVLWFGTLDYRALIKPDEGRYAEIAREMAASGDWVTPRLNGIKYFYKPPLQYWATAGAFEAFGVDEWTARLWPALTGFAGVLLSFWAGARLFGREVGLYAAAILASSLLYGLIGHLNTLDMGLAFFLHAAVCGFLLAQRPGSTPRAVRHAMLGTWAALALATLSKGIVAPVLAGATLVAYSLAARDASPWRRLHLLPGLVVFLAICAPWFVAVSLANPEFPRFFFIQEHFERFLTGVSRRVQPWWYFFPVLAAGALPWLSLMLHGTVRALREGGGFRPRLFLLVWCAVVFGFFTVSSSKLPSYILPVVPALALLAAAAVPEIGRRALVGHLAFAAALAIAGLSLVPLVPGRADAETPRWMMESYAAWLLAAAAAAACGALLALWHARADRRRPAILALAAGGLLGGTGILLGHESLSPSNSARQLAGQVRPLLSPGVPFYSVGMYEQTLPFYLQRPLTLVQYGDELSFGLAQEPDKGIADVSEFEARWRAAPDAFAVMTPEMHARLELRGLPMQAVARDTRRLIVRKR